MVKCHNKLGIVGHDCYSISQEREKQKSPEFEGSLCYIVTYLKEINKKNQNKTKEGIPALKDRCGV